MNHPPSALQRKGMLKRRSMQGWSSDSYTDTFVGNWDKINVFLVALTLMAGTAGLPHVIVRFYFARKSGGGFHNLCA